MKKQFLFLVMALALVGCAAEDVAASGQDGNIVLGTPVMVSQASPTLIRTVKAAPTPSATMVGTPTVDYQAKIGQSALALQQSLASATMAAVTQRVIDTAQAKLDAVQAKTGTAVVAVTQTLEVKAQKTADYNATGTVQAPSIAREWVRTQWEPVLQGTFCSGIVVVLVLLSWAIVALTRVKYAQMVGGGARPTPSVEMAKVQLDTRDEYGWGSVDWSTLPIDMETLRDVAELMVSGYHYTQNQMTGLGKPLVKDGNFDSFGTWMVNNKIAIRLGDGRYAIRHGEFFEQVLQ